MKLVTWKSRDVKNQKASEKKNQKAVLPISFNGHFFSSLMQHNEGLSPQASDFRELSDRETSLRDGGALAAETSIV